jgi:hypothetical protein
MKKIILSVGALLAFACGVYVIAADHIDTAVLTGVAEDVTDVYAFQSPANNSNMVLVCNTNGLISPANSTSASFSSNTMFEFNIDNNGDNVEDLVIQCTFENGKMMAYGPIKPSETGTMSTLMSAAPKSEVSIVNYADSKVGVIPNTTSPNGLKLFAGLRDDPFFFDLTQYQKVVGGTATGFNNPGMDTFAGTNVSSIIVELPKSLLNPPANNTINVWVESKKKI